MEAKALEKYIGEYVFVLLGSDKTLEGVLLKTHPAKGHRKGWALLGLHDSYPGKAIRPSDVTRIGKIVPFSKGGEK